MAAALRKRAAGLERRASFDEAQELLAPYHQHLFNELRALSCKARFVRAVTLQLGQQLCEGHEGCDFGRL